jgi:hypothetical protein
MRPSLEDQRYELIKSAILDPDNHPLPDYLQTVLERTVQASKLLEKNPVQKNAVAILRVKYPDISRSQAYEDCRRAERLFNSTHTFNYDFWQHWLLQDIAEMVQKAKNQNDLKAWAMGHKNLISALGEKPETEIDPKMLEKNTFIIQMNVNNKIVNIDYNKLMKLPSDARKILTEALDEEYNIEDATVIMNS